MAAQTPSPVDPGSSATYNPVTVNFGGNTTTCNVTFTTTGLPSGATASFSPTSVAGASNNTPKTTSLTVNTTAAILPGSYSFTVTAVAGSGCQGGNSTSAVVTLFVAGPTQLLFGQQPTSTSEGATISPAVTVRVLDAQGNLVTSGTGSTASIGLAITAGTGAGGAVLGGTIPQAAVGGIATFSNLSINLAGNNYRLTASSSGLTSVNSNTFDITAGNKATSTALASSPNPSAFGQSVTFTATIANLGGGGNPTCGTVDFKNGATNIGSGSVNASSQATFSTSALAVGTHSITAQYFPAASGCNFVTSTSSGLSQVVDKANTTTMITSDLPDPSVVGQSYTVNWTVTVNSPGAGTPTGTVTVSGGSGCSAPVAAGNCSVISTASGLKTLLAEYSGDANFNTSSDTESHQVNPADTTTVVTSSLNPSTYGDSVTFEATVTTAAPGSGTPLGNVSFYNGGTCAVPGTLLAGPTLLNAVGKASFSTTALSATAHTLLACYGGNSDFNSSSGSVNQTVNKKTASVTPDAKTKTYGNADPALTGTLSGFLVGDGVAATYNRTAGETVAGSPYTISATLSPAGVLDNYHITSNTAEFTITVLHITGSFTADSKVYDGSTAATVLTRSLSGTIGGDDVSLDGGTASFDNKNVGTGKTVTLAGAALIGADAGNYFLDSVSTTTANITVLHITGSFTADSKVYDGSTAATVLTRSLSGTIGGDAVSLDGGTASFDNKNVGTGKTVTLTGATLAGADAGNYFLDSVSTTTADITKRDLTVAAEDKEKNFDGTPFTSFTVSYSGFAPGEGTANLGGTLSFGGSAVGATGVGTYTIVPSGHTSDNYAIHYANGTLTIKDWQGPVTSNVLANPVPLNTPGLVTATVSDATKGNSNIASAEYRLGGTGSPWYPMTAADGNFNSPTENVRATLPAFAATGVYEVCVRGTDTASQTGSETNTPRDIECTLYAVYDPSAGFVTGGGWINSPAGAYSADPTLTGKANFGFVAKYQRGRNNTTELTGETEFQFKAGNLNFKSNSYEWLVVSGTRKAQFRGTGTINGTGNYSFVLTVIDDGSGNAAVDKFRIRIWGSGPVYDNQFGAQDTADPSTAIGGGSIVIHNK